MWRQTPQAPERRLVKVLCMRDLLYFYSHDIIGLAVTENEELTVEDELVCISVLGTVIVAVDVPTYQSILRYVKTYFGSLVGVTPSKRLLNSIGNPSSL